MSSSEIPPTAAKITFPLFTDRKLNIPAGSLMLVKFYNGEVLRGNLLNNPCQTKSKEMVELINVTDTIKNSTIEGSLIFPATDIWEVYLLEEAYKTRGIAKKEFTIPTVNVETAEAFQNFLVYLESQREVGVALCEGRGRNINEVTLVVISCRDSIFYIRVRLIETKCAEVWHKLQHKLFENPKVLKVFHNSRPLVHYLYHKKVILVENWYDTQLMDYILEKNKRPSLNCLLPQEMLSLFNTLEKYLRHLATEMEVNFVEAFEAPSTLTRKRKTSPNIADERNRIEYFKLRAKFLLPLYDELEAERNAKFTELFKSYAQQAISTTEPDKMNSEEPPGGLLEIIKRIFWKKN